MFTRAEWLRVPTDKASSRHVDHYIIPSVSMPLRGVSFLLESREHGTQQLHADRKTRDTNYSIQLGMTTRSFAFYAARIGK